MKRPEKFGKCENGSEVPNSDASAKTGKKQENRTRIRR